MVSYHTFRLDIIILLSFDRYRNYQNWSRCEKLEQSVRGYGNFFEFSKVMLFKIITSQSQPIFIFMVSFDFKEIRELNDII